MSNFRLFWPKWVIAGTLATASLAIQAATAFPALDRPALKVSAPERQVMQSAAQAGQRIVAVGERGIVTLSDDGGTTWRQAQNVPVSTTLTAVFFVDDKLGWAVGHGGAILHTRDGGETWVRQTEGRALAAAVLDTAEAAARRQPESPKARGDLDAATRLVEDGADKPLLDVFFSDASHGWAVGAYNLFFETHDGGKSWHSVGDRLDNPRSLHLNAIQARGTNVFIVGEQGRIYRSTDGGQTFTTLSSPYKGSLFTVSLAPGGHVVVAGLRGNAFSSEDSGGSWRRIEGLSPVSIFGMAVLDDGGVLFANQGGQLFVKRSGADAVPMPMPSLPPLAGMLVLRDGGIVVLGPGGAMRVPGESSKNRTFK